MQRPDTDEGRPQTRARRLVHRKSLTNGKWIDDNRKKRTVVPLRFVRACWRGHVDDIDWRGFAHGDPKTTCSQDLWMEEQGTTGDLGDVSIRCECGKERSMLDATRPGSPALGMCTGRRPWLGAFSKEPCELPSRLLIRHASNAYFPQLLSVISIPDAEELLVKAVSQVWEASLQHAKSLEDVAQFRSLLPPVQAALQGFTGEQVWNQVRARRGEIQSATTRPVKEVEVETLVASKEELGNDQPDGDFFARALPRAKWSQAWLGDTVERVVLVHRLREVVAQVGFTRFEAIGPDKDGELDAGVSRAPLGIEPTWLPAIENRGEGLFIGFAAEALKVWIERKAVQARRGILLKAFERWKAEHPKSNREFPDVAYVGLHSLSHLLLTAVALECGYPASSIRERVYAGNAGYGILLYTGSPDAEGTLGGLVEAGRRIVQHLRAALTLGELCSNDPVCAQHDPDDENEARFLHGAACHGCLLVAETSCEQRNDFLDRALVVPTVAGIGAELFSRRS